MAPRTRRSKAAGDSSAIDGAGGTPVSQPALPQRRGRSSKITAIDGNSTSSAPTPATTVSDSEYSTPATSNAVTPAPSITKKPTQSEVGVSRVSSLSSPSSLSSLKTRLRQAPSLAALALRLHLESLHAAGLPPLPTLRRIRKTIWI